jgi:DeoR/GlpR family transcriptional regulator of sugar metabolism
MDLPTVVSITALVLAVAAVVIALQFQYHGLSRVVDKTVYKVDTLTAQATTLVGNSAGILAEVKELRSVWQLRPDVPLLLATQWRFVEKVHHHRYEKQGIARRIVRNYIIARRAKKVLLDSGSTTDLVTFELLMSKTTGVEIHSNNVFSALHLAGAGDVPFYLLPGRFDERYAAVYSPEANEQVDETDFDLFVLAAVVLRREKGIMVHWNDDDNGNFKRTVLKAFLRRPDSQLLIAADASKFSATETNHRAVLAADEWQDIIQQAHSRIVIVTSPSAPDFDERMVTAAATEVQLFKEAGVQVDDGCSGGPNGNLRNGATR